MFELCILLGFNFPCEEAVTGDDINLAMLKVLNREEIQFSLHLYDLQHVFPLLQG